ERIRSLRDGSSASRRLQRVSLWAGAFFLVALFVSVAFRSDFSSWYNSLVAGALREKALARGSLAGFSPAAAESVALRCFDMVRADLLAVCAIGAAGFGGVYLFLRKRISLLLLVCVLGGLTLIDLWRVDARIFEPMVGERSMVTTEQYRDDTIEFLTADSSIYRVLPLGSDFTDNKYAAFGIASVGGYHAAKPALFERFHAAVIRPGKFTPGVLAMLNVKYLLLPEYIAPSPLLPLVHDGSRKVYEFKGVLPRVFLTDSARVLRDETSLLEEITSDRFDPTAAALLLEDVSPVPVSKEGSSARIESYGLNEVVVEADIARPCFMVLSELYYPDWKVEIDGASGKVYRVDFLLRGVPLAPGRHSVRFFYDSRSVKTGTLLTVSASVVIVASMLPAGVRVLRRGRRREVPGHSPNV
ncbi:MAG: hypothetical protein V2A71_01905, partial [Candidatus Eisenbacteria bacterium]